MVFLRTQWRSGVKEPMLTYFELSNRVCSISALWFDCPAFLDWMIAKHETGMVFSVERVGDELLAIEERLAQWTSERVPGFSRIPTDADLPSFAAVRHWAETRSNGRQLSKHSLQGSDYYLVGQALSGSHTVVMHEKPAATQRAIKISNACSGVGVECINLLEMLLMEQAQFLPGDTP